MNVLSQEIQNYINSHTQKEPKLLAQLRKETFQKTVQPHMISGEYQGRLLSLISKMIRPKYILELGTFTGYATICLAEGLEPNGEIITIDKNDELEYLSNKYFEQSEYKTQIKYLNGDVLEILPNLGNQIDLIFMDADKSNYINYFEQLLPKMSSGGVILADNVLWYGKVLHEAETKDHDTQILQDFNKKMLMDNRVEVVLLPIRDGLSLIRKK